MSAPWRAQPALRVSTEVQRPDRLADSRRQGGQTLGDQGATWLKRWLASARMKGNHPLATVPNLGVVQVPLLADDVHDLAGLRRLGAHLFA